MYVESQIRQSSNLLNSAKSSKDSTIDLAESLKLRWKALCDCYLPVSLEDSIWRYSRLRDLQDPEQGWKIHVSATILTAVNVLETVAPFLENQKALYKAPISLQELRKINSGVYYDYMQIGKFITVYPKNDDQAVYFAEQLHKLTCQFSAPAVPFDLKFKAQSCVYYRYGAFMINELKNSDGTISLAMRDQHGNLIPDNRVAEKNCPDWIVNPFTLNPKVSPANESPLKTDFRVIRALSQRGKGGVYQGIDLKEDTLRLCLIKEGRKNGEVEWDGRDGYWRAQNEEFALKSLAAANVPAPQIYSSFITGNNYYLVTEYIAGETLHKYLKKRKRRLRITEAIKFAIQISKILARIHSAGWLWRDCKPDNLILTKNSGLRPVDFEGACPSAHPDPVLWSTLVVQTPSWYEKNSEQFVAAADLFALGSIIYLLFEGELPIVNNDSIPKISRRKVPPEIIELISRLLDPKSTNCLEIQTVVKELETVQKVIGQ